MIGSRESEADHSLKISWIRVGVRVQRFWAPAIWFIRLHQGPAALTTRSLWISSPLSRRTPITRSRFASTSTTPVPNITSTPCIRAAATRSAFAPAGSAIPASFSNRNELPWRHRCCSKSPKSIGSTQRSSSGHRFNTSARLRSLGRCVPCSI